jgi:hypothetical protein
MRLSADRPLASVIFLAPFGNIFADLGAYLPSAASTLPVSPHTAPARTYGAPASPYLRRIGK